jgi:REP element-mobilizing transposase RayT
LAKDHDKGPSPEPVELSGFQPVNPWRSAERGEGKRHLPHLQTPQATYFVTFRCQKGLSLSNEARDIVMSAIRYWDGLRLELDAAVVMPDHVHLIVRVLEGLPLGEVLKSIKGFSARAINRILASHGPLWIGESFDHIIRHEQEWEEKVAYVRDNPVKRGIVASWQEYPWLWIRG